MATVHRSGGIPRIEFLAVLMTLALAPLGFAEPSPNKGGPPPSDLLVTTVIENVDANGVVCTILSDGPDPYVGGQDGVASYLTANVCNGLTWGDWRFNTRGSSRQVSETFLDTDKVTPGDPHYRGVPASPPPSGSEPHQPWMNVQCTCRSNQSMYTMIAGQTITCPLLNNWTDPGGNNWTFSAGKTFTGYPETTDAKVTCNSAPAGHCVEWYIEPIDRQRPGSTDEEAVGRVVGPPSCKGRCGDTDDGDFYMRFRIHVTLP